MSEFNPSNVRIGWITGLLLIAATIFLVTILRFQPKGWQMTSAPRASTVSGLKQIKLGIYILELDMGKDIQAILSEPNPNNPDLNVIFTSLLARQISLHRTSLVQGNPLRMVDGWGRPFVFRWRKEILRENPASPLLRQTNALVIWSIGQNGTNEQGRGDDISLKGSVRANEETN